MTDATLDPAGDRPAVRLERILPDPPEVVWRAITDREQLKGWFPCDVIVDGGRWTAGAAISFPFPADVIDMTLTGTVLEVEEPRLLSFTWGESETLTFELFSQNGSTRLVLTDRLDRGHAARNAVGWDDCLDRLAGLPARTGSWQERFEVYSAAFEPEIGPQEGPPAGMKA
ncbi:MAG: SRPBCC domain-containing protein [Streptosporangiales bacterium]|nr:SRPBCC domain-containing protein [Streptosporangiales bacterium]